jgi:tRNA(His) 5'-end guanylyltransferase
MDIGDRMKLYEGVSDARLPPRIPIIIRVDGKAFHTLTAGMDRPWDLRFVECMIAMTTAVCREIDGCKFAFVQSDEASFLLTDWERFDTQSWFKYRVQKMASIAAAIATDEFNRAFRERFSGTKFIDRRARFDARVASYPRHEVTNYYVWRQQDATRNSIQMLAQAKLGHSRCHGQNTSQLQELLHAEHGINWNDTTVHLKRGAVVYKDVGDTRSLWVTDQEPPIFTQDRAYIERHLPEVFWRETESGE